VVPMQVPSGILPLPGCAPNKPIEFRILNLVSILYLSPANRHLTALVSERIDGSPLHPLYGHLSWVNFQNLANVS
jgi:hypothetical protein